MKEEEIQNMKEKNLLDIKNLKEEIEELKKEINELKSNIILLINNNKDNNNINNLLEYNKEKDGKIMII